jgi:hypothetical protein
MKKYISALILALGVGAFVSTTIIDSASAWNERAGAPAIVKRHEPATANTLWSRRNDGDGMERNLQEDWGQSRHRNMITIYYYRLAHFGARGNIEGERGANARARGGGPQRKN